MPSQFVVLDESKSEKHPILSVGGIVVNADDIPEIEREWAAMKRATNLADRPVKYSMTWPNAALRIHLLGQIGRLPVRAIAALLEDFRPLRMNAKRETRAEAYVHLKAFEYVLQRLPEEVFHDSACVPNFVVLDHRSDFKLFADRYGKHHRVDWSFASGRTVPSLGSVGYATGLHHSHDGALNEIADMTISCITRWVGARAAAHRGKAVAEVDELDREAAAIIDLSRAHRRPSPLVVRVTASSPSRTTARVRKCSPPTSTAGRATSRTRRRLMPKLTTTFLSDLPLGCAVPERWFTDRDDLGTRSQRTRPDGDGARVLVLRLRPRVAEGDVVLHYRARPINAITHWSRATGEPYPDEVFWGAHGQASGRGVSTVLAARVTAALDDPYPLGRAVTAPDLQAIEDEIGAAFRRAPSRPPAHSALSAVRPLGEATPARLSGLSHEGASVADGASS
jgi:hypothetical protein